MLAKTLVRRAVSVLSLLPLPLFALAFDLIVRARTVRAFSPTAWAFYLLSFAISVSMWYLTLALLRRIRARRALFLIVLSLVSAAYALALAGSYSYYSYTGILPNYFVFSYLWDEPLNSYTLARDGGGVVALVAFFAIFAALCVALSRLTRVEKKDSWKIPAPATVCFALLFPILIHNSRYRDQLYVPDANAALFAASATYSRLSGQLFGAGGLQARSPMKVAPVRPVNFNVLFIVAESLRKDRLGLYGYAKPTTPFMSRFVSEHKQQAFVFDHAYSNASSTLISITSLFTGVLPTEPAERVHRYPTIWEYGKAARSRTFYITSHDQRWNNLGGYFKNAGIDHVWDRNSSPNRAYNDLGIDDRETLAAFKKHLVESRATPGNFVGVLHLNTNHFPYNAPPEYSIPGDLMSARYDSSVLFFDTLLEDVFHFLDSTKLLNHTVVILTSDHAESLTDHGYVGHIESNYREVLAIPLVLFVPERVANSGRFSTRAMVRNTQANVMNGDLVPTLLDLMEFSRGTGVAASPPVLAGTSLLRPVDPQRPILISNNSEISLYRVGFSLVRDRMHYIYKYNASRSIEELYDTTLDPGEKQNLWSSIGPREQQEFRGQFAGCQICQTIFREAQ